MIKMIAMDFDWTLVDHSVKKNKVGKELIDELNSFIKKGNYAGIVSGRVYWNFQTELESFGIEWANPFPNYIIAREAYIYKIDKDNYIENEEYNPEIKQKIMALNVELAKHLDEIIALYKRENIKINNFMVYGDFGVEIHVAEKDAQKAMLVMEEFVKDKNIKDAAVHRNGIMITIYHKQAGKGNTLLEAAKSFGIKPQEVLAIGDNYNDISMIDGKLGFVGACVGNADDNIKEIVRNGGGYVGEGMAYRGILDVIRQLKADGLMD